MLKPQLKIAFELRRDWGDRVPKGTRVIVDKFRAEPNYASGLAVHVYSPHLPGSGDGWISSIWLRGYYFERQPR
jgi:hypothetical protein